MVILKEIFEKRFLSYQNVCKFFNLSHLVIKIFLIFSLFFTNMLKILYAL